MIETIKNLFSIQASVGANRIIYYFQKLPFIGKLLKDNIYRETGAKLLFSVLATIGKLLLSLLMHMLYLGLFVLLPIAYLKDRYPTNYVGDYYVHILFFMSFIGATFYAIDILNPSLIKFISVRIMKMKPRNFILAKLLMQYIPQFILFTPILIIVTMLIKLPFWWGISLGITIISFRIFSNALHLYFYAKKKVVLNKNYLISIPGYSLPIILAYILPATNTYVLSSKVLISIPSFLVCILLGILGIVYMNNYSNYSEAVEIAVKLDNPLYNMKKIMKESKFKDVEIKDKYMTVDSLNASHYANSHGYDYLNKVFFKRHRRMVVKPALIRVILVLITLVVGIVTKYVSPNSFTSMAEFLLKSTPLFVFIMYVISTGEKISRAMFYNCDISLLRYAFYRSKKVILKNFGIRLRKVVATNMIPALAIDLSIVIIILLSSITFEPVQLLIILLSILCLAIFFSVHHLFMYYIFQPLAVNKLALH